MKKIFSMLAVLAGLVTSAQQELYNNGSVIYISTGASIRVNGQLTNKATSTITNNGTITITGDLVNDAVMTNYNSGIISFVGTTIQSISGAQNFWANDVTFNNTAGLLSVGIPKVRQLGIRENL